MPILPDATSLGRVSPSGGRAISDPSSAFSGAQEKIVSTAARSGAGLEHLGEGVQRLGAAASHYVEHIGAEEKKKNDLIALNDAKTSWLLSASNLGQTLDGETDPAHIGKTYPDAFNTAAEVAKQNLNDEQKAHFDGWVTPHLISAQEVVNSKIGAINKDIGTARTLGNIEQFKNLAVRQPNAGAAMGQLPNIRRELDTGAEKGYWTRAHAEQEANRLTTGVATDWMEAQPDPTKIKVLGGWQGSLKHQESGGNPTRVNPFGFAGLYQFGAPRLADIGVYTPGPNENLKTWNKTGKDAAGKWTGAFNVPGHPEVKTISDFLSSPDAQEAAFGAHVGKMDQEIQQNDLAKHIGKTVGGVPITREGLYAMMHLGGAGGAKAALESGDNRADANGTKVLDYARHGLAEDRRIAELIPPDKQQAILHGAASRRIAEINQADAAMKEQLATQAAVDQVNSGVGVNAFDPNGKKTLTKAYAGLVQSGVGPNEALTHIVDQTKAVPPEAVQGLRQGLSASDPDTVAGSATLALNLMSRGGNAIFKPYGGGDEISKEATKFEHYSDYMSAQDAAKKIIAERDPSYQAKIKAQRDTNGLEKSLSDDEKAGSLLDDIGVKFGEPRFGGLLGTRRAQIAFREGDRQQAIEDYKDRIREHYDTTSDYALARKLAQKDLSNVWGQTNVTGSPVAMRYPPESAPAFVGISNVGDRIAQQVLDEIKAQNGAEVDRSKIILDPVEGGATMRAYWAGKAPPYHVSWVDKNGHLQMLNPGYAFVPDVEKMHKDIEGQFRTAQTAKARGPMSDLAPELMAP